MKPIFVALALLTAPIAAGSVMFVLPASAKAASDLGDLSSFRKILVDVQGIARAIQFSRLSWPGLTRPSSARGLGHRVKPGDDKMKGMN
jgi:hypothetical protein